MTNPITELASLDLDQLWQRVYASDQADTPTLEAFIARLREAHAMQQGKEDRRANAD